MDSNLLDEFWKYLSKKEYEVKNMQDITIGKKDVKAKKADAKKVIAKKADAKKVVAKKADAKKVVAKKADAKKVVAKKANVKANVKVVDYTKIPAEGWAMVDKSTGEIKAVHPTRALAIKNKIQGCVMKKCFIKLAK